MKKGSKFKCLLILNSALQRPFSLEAGIHIQWPYVSMWLTKCSEISAVQPTVMAKWELCYEEAEESSVYSVTLGSISIFLTVREQRAEKLAGVKESWRRINLRETDEENASKRSNLKLVKKPMKEEEEEKESDSLSTLYMAERKCIRVAEKLGCVNVKANGLCSEREAVRNM